jgi:hypothetical protein
MVVGSIAVFGTIRKPGSSDKTPDVLTTSTGGSSVPPVYTDKVPPRDFSKDAGKGTIIDVPVEDTEKDK